MTSVSRFAQFARLAFVATLVCVPMHEAQAQLAIDKLDLVLQADGAEERTGVLTVRNEGTTPAQAVIKLEDWDRAPDGNNRFYPVGTISGSCANSLQVFPMSLSLKPGEAQTVRIDYTGPARLSRECWSLVVVESPTSTPQGAGRQLMYNVRTGLKVYVAHDGLAVDGEVEGLSVARTTRNSVAHDVAIVAFANRGAKHYVTKGRLEIRRDDNSLVQTIDLPPMYALPGAVMHTTATLPDLPKGKYLLLSIVDYGGQEIAAGMYSHDVR
ncbi:molecular chaperone [Gemmatimonas sp.]|jgi:P pilus assembly chaperone PapD|uniref:molecular chaperone n=1 Tax=Gemmatimonas sp. TaxID=1962908 RepID=UPI0037C00578